MAFAKISFHTAGCNVRADGSSNHGRSLRHRADPLSLTAALQGVSSVAGLRSGSNRCAVALEAGYNPARCRLEQIVAPGLVFGGATTISKTSPRARRLLPVTESI